MQVRLCLTSFLRSKIYSGHAESVGLNFILQYLKSKIRQAQPDLQEETHALPYVRACHPEQRQEDQ